MVSIAITDKHIHITHYRKNSFKPAYTKTFKKDKISYASIARVRQKVQNARQVLNRFGVTQYYLD